MTKLNIIGDYFGSSGYSSHTKQLAQALNKYCEVSLTCNRPSNWARLMEDEEFKMLSRNPQEADMILCIDLPFNWKFHLVNNKPFIGFCVWEGDKVPISWIEIFLDERVSQIWVPSNHVSEAIEKTVEDGDFTKIDIMNILKKINIVPHGVNSKIFYPNKKEKKDNILRFVCGKGWPRGSKDRGGLSYLLKAYMEEFSKEDKVEMIVKINSVYGMNNEILNKNMAELNIQNKNPPLVKFIIETVDYKELINFYNMGDVVCSTSMAEGFNLNILEAMACGLPALTTTFGGMSDFCNEKNSWLIEEGKMLEVDWDILYEGVRWKKPSITDIKKKLRYIYEHQNEISTKSLEALNTSKEFSWDNSAKKAIDFLKEIK